MRQTQFSSTKIYAVIALCVLQGVWTGTIAAAAERGLPDFPTSFDSRERLAKPDLSTLQRLRFLTTVDFPPFNFIDQTGKLAGFHIDLVRAICHDLEIESKCQIQALPFAELRDDLEKDAGEAVIAGMAVTSGLRRDFTFSRPYLRLPARFVVRTAAAPAGDGARALSGRPVGVVRSSVHEAMLKAYFPALRPVPFDRQGDLFSALKSGGIDAAFGDGLQMAFWIAGSQAEQCCRLFDGPYFSEPFLGEGLTVMTRKDQPAVSAAIDHALLSLTRSGRLGEIYLRYFPVSIY
ncbi:transporter substrate-binding domain-containing protein [Mycoplana dimorpha]|uniref:Amino acid ABC transporter substrate-binding protein (PAAT family) n=1 Tax=Mycoplana dimorpha TaxID=28320 RepID=A0A2T5BF80_MYCDI|nr:amino acid ABC transporter substrate-binding protein (PAAT family) [Mycoplana dimorpha]